MKYTVEQKYEFLLSLLEITDVDNWEQDAFLEMTKYYFQFYSIPDKDAAVEWIMSDFARLEG